MPSVSEGLSGPGGSQDVNTDAGFNAAVAEQARREAPAEQPSEGSAYSRAVEQVNAGTEEIHAAILAPGRSSADVYSGLTTEGGGVNRWGMSPAEQARVRAEYRELEEAGAFKTSGAAALRGPEAEELARYRREHASAAALEALEEGEALERAIAWKFLSPEDRQIAVEEGLVADGAEVTELDALAAELFAVINHDEERRAFLKQADE